MGHRTIVALTYMYVQKFVVTGHRDNVIPRPLLTFYFTLTQKDQQKQKSMQRSGNEAIVTTDST